jgi:hypothetical protein
MPGRYSFPSANGKRLSGNHKSSQSEPESFPFSIPGGLLNFKWRMAGRF